MRTSLTTGVLTAVTLIALTGCDLGDRKDFGSEREGALYQAAMTDYKAGRIASAIEGFRKACRQDPANASARFQLACLLQDSGRDYLEALCAYRDFMLLAPSSEKLSLAKDRAAMCEVEAAKALAAKHGLTNVTALNQQMEALQKKLKDAERRNLKLSDDVAVAMQRVAHLRTENARLKAALKGDSGEAEPAPKVDLADARKLLDEDDGERLTLPDEVRKLRREREDDTDRIRNSADIAALRRESDADAEAAEPPPLPKVDPSTVRRVAPAPAPARPSEPPHEKRPATYVVQEGDTLYRIAMRFYGRKGAWKLIREANKAVISIDGRVDKGMRIRLPEPK